MLEWLIVLLAGGFFWIIYLRHLHNVEKKREELNLKRLKELNKDCKRPNALQRKKMEDKAKKRFPFQSDGKIYLHGHN